MDNSLVQTPEPLSTFILDQPPSCLAFCPTAPEHILISTYLLTEIAGENSETPVSKRTGSLQLLKFDPATYQLSRIQKLPLESAVFDFQFSPRDPSLLGVALSTSDVALFHIKTIDEGEAPPEIVFIRSIPVHENPKVLALYFSWIPSNAQCPGNKDNQDIKDGFAVSFSDGRVSVFSAQSNIESVPADEVFEIRLGGDPIEVWYIAFRMEDTSFRNGLHLYAGDDLSRVRGVNLGNISPSEMEQHLSWELDDRGRGHDAGVTAILPLLADGTGTTLLTGSYDEYFRVYHFSRRSEILASAKLGGGVWRLKMIRVERAMEMPSVRDNSVSQAGLELICTYLVLASCMHGGARLVRIRQLRHQNQEYSRDEWAIDILAKFTEHKSMNYASDIYRGEKLGALGKETVLCATSSFYDKRIYTWAADVEREETKY